ncbi:MAG: catechol 2,3-dioxygenase-like lactoylglutathione lyase family enzyme [Alphaproteobacteria bacterium]|jgi:catechol 2,3-dioxygenase-like lactoylglutathione lyase family enzyme
MQIGKLDHVNVRTANLDKMVAWYGDMLGMKPGKRPNFPFPGAWLYTGDNAAIHLIGIEQEPPAQDDLRLEHFAFQATGFAALKERLATAGERHDVNPVPGAGIVQINCWDPDGNHIHVDFPTAEAAE